MHFAAVIAWLLGGMAAGVLVYGALVMGLWTLAGRPQGAERAVMDRLRGFATERFGGRFMRRRQA
jgi:hypothetical protein